ncbi:MAG: ATP-binding protein, partial [Victivallales bacterium]|nr:ATP-binding protein [Victivallales bacterium]
LREIFEREKDIRRLLTAIQLEVGFKPTPEDTLIVFDEIQDSPGALTSLKYFCEEAPEYAITAAGSQLGISDMHGTGFPVGKVASLYLYPLSFCEFLAAIGQKGYSDLLQDGDWDMICAYRDHYIDLLRQYYYIGGMPEVVDDYATNGDFMRVRELQNSLLQNYRDDFGKHAPQEEVRKIEMIWDSVPKQLAKENKKFLYNDVQSRIRGKDLLVAMQYLLGAGLIRHTEKISKPDVPLNSYADGGFKVFVLDVGLLSAMTNLQTNVLLEECRVFEEFKGALVEQYVQQEIMACFGARTFYWASDKAHNEVDFLLDSPGTVIPLECKASFNVKAKSIKAFCTKFSSRIAVRASLVKYYRQTIATASKDGEGATSSYELIDLPLYALCRLTKEIGG